MNIRKLREQLTLHEGVKMFPYEDTKGFVTIGIGRNLDTNPLSYEEKRYIFNDPNISYVDYMNRLRLSGLTSLQTHYLLENDIQVAIKFLKRLSPIFDDLSEVVQFVLIDMMFNLGYGTMRKSYGVIINLIEHGKFEEAVQQIQLRSYAKQVGHRDNRLCVMLLKNKYHDEVTQKEILEIEKNY